MFFFINDCYHIHEEQKKNWQKKHNIFIYEKNDFVLEENKILQHPLFPICHGFYFDHHIKVQLQWKDHDLLSKKKIIDVSFDSQKVQKILYKNQKRSLLWKDIVFLNQIHGSDIININEQESWICSGDGLISCSKPIGIVTADCVSFLLYYEKKNIIGALHGGWRGCTQGILTEGLKKIINYDIQNIKEKIPFGLDVLIGPSIGSKYFCVSLDIVHSLKQQQKKHDSFWNIRTYDQWFFKENDSYYVDLSFYSQCLLQPLVSRLFVVNVDTYGSLYSHRFATIKKNEHYFLIKSILLNQRSL